MLNPRDLQLYLCTDQVLSLGRSLTETVEAAIAGGVTRVQLREKEASSREFYEIALKVKAVTQKHGVPLVINDRPDIALAVGAQGIHIGQSDLPLGVVRKLVGKALFIGVSAGTPREALAAQEEGADYLGVGAVYPTGSKADAGDAIGPAGLLAVRQAVSLPVVGIGGIGPQNAGEVKKTGAAGIAVISAILSQPDITAAAEALRRAWNYESP
jgi:thiamine-phosphate pyrophosphorylase